VTAEALAEPVSTGAVDLSAFSSMLKSKWKTGDSPAASSSKAKESEPVKPGQVRSFRIGTLDSEAKRIELVLDQTTEK
jgi:small subunit ribosomal protein S1